jgi:hypothetical protein
MRNALTRKQLYHEEPTTHFTVHAIFKAVIVPFFNLAK